MDLPHFVLPLVAGVWLGLVADRRHREQSHGRRLATLMAFVAIATAVATVALDPSPRFYLLVLGGFIGLGIVAAADWLQHRGDA
jgi:MFS family permease